MRVKPNINRRPGFYDPKKKNPYHDYVIAAQKHFGMITFDKDHEFWTLGGREWCEFKVLVKHFTFGPRSYHSIDYDRLDQNSDERVVAHSFTDFMDSYRYWRKPAVINFDSVNILTKRNDDIWGDVTNLVAQGMNRSQRICFHANIMTQWANIQRATEKDSIEQYNEWVCKFITHIGDFGYNVDVFDGSIWSPKEGSITPMISFHCLIEK